MAKLVPVSVQNMSSYTHPSKGTAVTISTQTVLKSREEGKGLANLCLCIKCDSYIQYTLDLAVQLTQDCSDLQPVAELGFCAINTRTPTKKQLHTHMASLYTGL